MQKASPFSHLKVFKALTQIRQSNAFLTGALKIEAINTDILAYTRSLTGGETYVILLNLSSAPQTLNLLTTFPSLSSNLEVIVSSLHSAYVTG